MNSSSTDACRMSNNPWSLSELIATLSSGSRLPGEPTGDPPWPIYLDDEYRRITAANCIAEHFGHCTEAMNALREYASSGDNAEVRCRCVTLLGQLEAIGELVIQLLDDPEPELRLYAVEFILVNQPHRFDEIDSQLRDDADWQIRETLSCFRDGKERPLYQYDFPDGGALNR